MDERLAQLVRQRAAYRCEYCHLPESLHPGPFENEHVLSRQHGGRTVESNLAWSCLHCNRHKGPNLVGTTFIRGRRKLVPLFNPRRHKWDRHFRWDGPYLFGRTAIGRVTIQVLAINDPARVELRIQLIDEGLFP